MPALVLILVMALLLGCSSIRSAPPPATSKSDATTAAPSLRPTAPSLGDRRALPAGTYLIDYLPQAHITVTVPADWEAFQGWAILKYRVEPPMGMGLGFKLVENVYADSCDWEGTLMDPPIGSSVDDLVAALALQPERTPTTPVPITVDGFQGKAIDFTVPADLDFATCDASEYRSYTTMNWDGTDHGVRFHQGAGQTDRNWILDVEGHRLAINGSFFPGTSAADRAELEAMMASIRIDP